MMGTSPPSGMIVKRRTHWSIMMATSYDENPKQKMNCTSGLCTLGCALDRWCGDSHNTITHWNHEGSNATGLYVLANTLYELFESCDIGCSLL